MEILVKGIIKTTVDEMVMEKGKETRKATTPRNEVHCVLYVADEPEDKKLFPKEAIIIMGKVDCEPGDHLKIEVVPFATLPKAPAVAPSPSTEDVAAKPEETPEKA